MSRERDLDMMNHPSKWPARQYLPLTRGKETALLAENDIQDGPHTKFIILYSANLFDAQSISRAHFDFVDTAEEIYDDGWRVD